MLSWIALDADDTLWHNETLFAGAQARFRELLAPYAAGDAVDSALYAVEMRNLEYFGYGVKGFTFSMLETAVELTGGEMRGADLLKIIAIAKEMIKAPVELLEGVKEVVCELAPRVNLMVLTKGDLLDQEAKLARSGIDHCFKAVEIVSDKTPAVYAAIMVKYEITPDSFLMVGNSLRSDILPVIEAGGHAVHIPYHITWQHETLVSEGDHQYGELASIIELPAYLAERGWL